LDPDYDPFRQPNSDRATA